MNSDLTQLTMNTTDNAATIPVRKTSQYLMPAKIELPKSDKEYNIYPFYSLGEGQIFNGYESLAQWIISKRTVIIDGYVGVFWDKIQAALHHYFFIAGLTVNWVRTEHYLKPTSIIEDLVKPFLGEEDSVWGTKCSVALVDLYDKEKLEKELPDENFDINVFLGAGAALSNWEAPVIYIDLPKNELQYRMRAGSVFNLGCMEINEPAYMYKRFYFVDWVLLNEHKKSIGNNIAVIADGQWPDDINWMYGSALNKGLKMLSESVLRVRPWFEPGAWGGQWLKNIIPSLNKDVVNYAWSFELIVPENGLVFESDGLLLEVSFDYIMFLYKEAVLGNHASTFGDQFPIRFDFLDTFDGGNLSIQCHPSKQYIQTNFGETITQDETYYILDCQKQAKVYLGFQENINPVTFKEALQTSQDRGIKIEIEDFVQSHPAQKHDLFLIPNQTVHSAGAGNLVLEISATPYIFTFKMYDWLRMDLDGKPRPINIEHAFNNLDFNRKGTKVHEELISKTSVIDQGPDWQLIHYPTHSLHFYDVHRIDFTSSFDVNTENKCHVLMLVEGSSIIVQTANGTTGIFNYAETFVIPAAAQSYKLINKGEGMARVIKTFLK
jgi:mannose-6-phosphate isomerase class I